MKYFLDTEFHEDGRTIDLISIGIVAEDGREFYRESADYDYSRAAGDEFLSLHVLPHILGFPELRKPRAQIREDLLAFVGEDQKPEFWAYYADYDWVVLCQLFGRMIDLPKHFPKFCLDLKQLSVSAGNPRHPKQKGAVHSAIADARWNRDLYRFITALRG
jgi:hypothetical protein